jgi:ABC-type nitrate/sulfonate/bicarbonate transport system ATPase subunit
MAGGPELNLDIAEKRFGEAEPLFCNFKLNVAAGSFVTIVGPSGVGKTTLLRMLAGIDLGFTGSITIDGVPAGKAPAPGFVLQDARLLPWLTVVGNVRAVAPGVTSSGLSRLLGQVGLAGTELQYPHQLSGGMQRRVALVRALSFNPRLLLLDEPFVSLDRTLVNEMQALLLDLLATKRPTAVLVTHLAEDAARLADRTIVLCGRPARIAADLKFEVAPAGRSAADRLRLIETIETAATERAQ